MFIPPPPPTAQPLKGCDGRAPSTRGQGYRPRQSSHPARPASLLRNLSPGKAQICGLLRRPPRARSARPATTVAADGQGRDGGDAIAPSSSWTRKLAVDQECPVSGWLGRSGTARTARARGRAGPRARPFHAPARDELPASLFPSCRWVAATSGPIGQKRCLVRNLGFPARPTGRQKFPDSHSPLSAIFAVPGNPGAAFTVSQTPALGVLLFFWV